MRQDIEEKIIIKQNVDEESKDKESKAIFKTYVDKKTLGTRLLESYLKQRVRTDENFIPNENGEYNVFYGDDKDERCGYLSDIYGYVGVLSLALRMEVQLSDELKNDLVRNIDIILDSIKDYGYNLFPYITPEENQHEKGKLFDKNYPYVGAMTWALSFFTSVRKAVKLGIIELSERRQAEIVNNIKLIISNFNSFFIDNGDSMGWGYTLACKTPSLFFTYSVLEAYSDFEDNVFDITFIGDEELRTVKDEELLKAINKDRKEGDKHIDEQWKENCRAVADKVWSVYKDVLKEEFVDDNFISGYRIVKRDDILKSERSNALFNNIYLVSILLYGYVNRRSADKDDVIMTMESALQNVQRVYNQLRRDGMEYLVDTYIIPFKSKHKDKDREDVYIKNLNYKSLVDATLMPMLVKANNIIAFYISQYPVKQMSALFEDLFDSIQEKAWREHKDFLWENKGYDVKITERYIEAIADFYGYYEEYERDYAKKKNSYDAKTAALVRKAKEVGREKAIEEANEQANKRYEENVQAVRKEYTIENAIRKSIEGGVVATVSSLFNGIADKLANGSQDEFTPAEEAVYSSIENLIHAYVIKTISKATVNKDTLDTVLCNLKTDTDMFLAEWSEKLANTDDVIAKLIKGDT